MLVASPLPPTLSEALSCKVKRQMRLPRRMRLRNLKPTVPNVNGAGRYKPMPSKLIDPIAIRTLVSRACQSFELLERLHEGSVVLSPGVLIPSGSNRRVSPQTRSLLSPFSLPAPARQPAQVSIFSESQDLSRQRFFDASSEEAHHDIRMLGRDSV
jgi:hypothetical protein